MVTCKACGKQMGRITAMHLRSDKCSGNLTTLEEYKAAYPDAETSAPGGRPSAKPSTRKVKRSGRALKHLMAVTEDELDDEIEELDGLIEELVEERGVLRQLKTMLFHGDSQSNREPKTGVVAKAIHERIVASGPMSADEILRTFRYGEEKIDAAITELRKGGLLIFKGQRFHPT